MFRRYAVLAAGLALALIAVVPAQAKQSNAASSKILKIAVIDAEGGAASVILTPEGKSIVIDTGVPPNFGHRRANEGGPPQESTPDRIVAAAKAMGITKIDYLIVTHYHLDHVGGAPALVKMMPVDTFVDHGPNRETTPSSAPAWRQAIDPARYYPDWVALYQGHRHISIHVGQTLKVGSLHIQFVTSDGKVLKTPLPGAGEPNPLCMNVPQKPDTYAANGGEENARSLGMLMTFGKTRILDLGDLTWNKELELLCPVNKVGKVDLYYVTGHGMDLSSSPPTAAFDPLVAVMQNGARKGGDPSVVRTVDGFPELEGFWRLHASARYPDMDGDPHYIANLNGEPDHGYPIDIDITGDGKITVTNPRNSFTRTYRARGTGAGY